MTAKGWLADEQISFEVRDIRLNPEYIDDLIQMGINATPAFVIGEEIFTGFNPGRIKEAWENYKVE